MDNLSGAVKAPLVVQLSSRRCRQPATGGPRGRLEELGAWEVEGVRSRGAGGWRRGPRGRERGGRGVEAPIPPKDRARRRSGAPDVSDHSDRSAVPATDITSWASPNRWIRIGNRDHLARLHRAGLGAPPLAAGSEHPMIVVSRAHVRRRGRSTAGVHLIASSPPQRMRELASDFARIDSSNAALPRRDPR